MDQYLISVRPNPLQSVLARSVAWRDAIMVECDLFFIYSTNVCAHVQIQTHLQLLTSSQLVLLHHKGQLVPSLKSKKMPTHSTNDDILRTGNY